ncbi:hypothetical protein [Leucobacter sp. L43]|uniref:hypothetical protein n=1 Tax=Leucobacter sp. L43 TaxID=2798040 RepID=UPI0019049AC4|nr:hypothetical protein [Leucobacter sp. L43]
MNDPEHIVQIIPGGAWNVFYSNKEGGTFSSPVVAWALLANGDVRAMDVDRNGLVDFATSINNFHRIEAAEKDGTRA